MNNIHFDDLTNIFPKTPKTPKTPKRTPRQDRFIPSRRNQDLEIQQYKLSCNENESNQYTNALEQRLFQGKLNGKVLSLSEKAPMAPEWHQNNLRVLYSQNKIHKRNTNKITRYIPQAPERILDAPGLLDDYYLNLLDWNVDNILSVALHDTVYLWNATTGGIQQLMKTEGIDNYVTSISFIEDGSYLAIGTFHNDVQIWDIQAQKRVRCMKGHEARVGAMSWNSYILTSGSRDGKIIHHDVRVANHITSVIQAHEQDVCGLKWNPDGTHLASGGNDNVLKIWSAGSTTPKFTMTEHVAAVKALAWCPWQGNLLVSGGGTADRHLRFWNTSTGVCTNSVDTKSQVCSIIWSKHSKELVSSHGFSQNQLIVWKYPSLVQIAELKGHTSRVLHLAQSPDGSTIVSAAGDETLRFWNVFESPRAKKQTISSLSVRDYMEDGRNY